MSPSFGGANGGSSSEAFRSSERISSGFPAVEEDFRRVAMAAERRKGKYPSGEVEPVKLSRGKSLCSGACGSGLLTCQIGIRQARTVLYPVCAVTCLILIGRVMCQTVLFMTRSWGLSTTIDGAPVRA